MDWGASGITNTYEFEVLHHTDLNQHIGWLDCVTGGQLDYGYRTELRASGSLDISGDLPKGSYCIRVWHTAKLGGETFRECMGTFIPDSKSIERVNEHGKGSIDLYSVGTYKLSKRKSHWDCPVKKGTASIAYIKSLASIVGASVVSQVAEKNVTADRVREFGVTFLSEAIAIADLMGARIDADRTGAINVVPYVPASRKTVSVKLPNGAKSVVMPGVSIENPTVINRVICKATINGATTYRQAVLSGSHPWSMQNIGYWSDAEYSPSGVSTVAQLESYAKSRLTELSSAATKKKVKSLYVPFEAGQIAEAFCEGEWIVGLIASASVRLNAAMETTFEIEV